jgi:hypothetical protein
MASVLAFEAPYLEEKLLKDHIAATREEALALFAEVKRYLILTHLDRERGYPMISLVVDAVWHEFVLFTDQYTRFCQDYFGGYMPHAPANAPKPMAVVGGDPAPPEATYQELCAAYQDLHGIPLPPVWLDENHVALGVRLRNDHLTDSRVRVVDGRAELVRDGVGVLARVDAWAEEALRFVATHAAFYPRELPGRLADVDRVALCRALVHSGALRVSP